MGGIISKKLTINKNTPPGATTVNSVNSVNSPAPRLPRKESVRSLENESTEGAEPQYFSRKNRPGSVPLSKNKHRSKAIITELNNIDQRLKKIKQEISETSTKQNLISLHDYLRLIQTDLQNLNVEGNPEHESIKNRLEKEQTDLYILSVIKNDIHLFDNLNDENFEKLREKFHEHKVNLEAMDSIDEEIKSEKFKVSQLLTNIENKLNAFETEIEIIKAEETYEESVKTLQILKDDLGRRTTTDKNIQDRKNAIIKKIENIVVTYDNSKTTEPNKNQEENPEASLSKMERRLDQLQTEVSSFCGVESNDEYFEIDEPLIQMTLKLDCFKFEEDSELHKRKVALLKKVSEVQSELDKTVEQTKTIKKIEREIEEISFKTDSLKDSTEISILEHLRDRFKKLTSTVNLLEPNNEPLKKKKTECSDKISGIEAKFDNLSK